MHGEITLSAAAIAVGIVAGTVSVASAIANLFASRVSKAARLRSGISKDLELLEKLTPGTNAYRMLDWSVQLRTTRLAVSGIASYRWRLLVPVGVSVPLITAWIVAAQYVPTFALGQSLGDRIGWGVFLALLSGMPAMMSASFTSADRQKLFEDNQPTEDDDATS